MSQLSENSGRDRAIDRVLDALRAGGHAHTHRGTHIQASCPLHTDQHPSLSIDYRDGKVWAKCHSGDCGETAIAEALGLRHDQLWDEPAKNCVDCGKLTLPNGRGEYIHDYCAARRDGTAPPRTARQPKTARPKLGPMPAALTRPVIKTVKRARVVATYEHMTTDGEIVAESVRRESVVQVDGGDPQPHKDFVQRYAVAGQWLKTKPADLHVPLWRLPDVEIAIAAGETIWLAEGHKDALKLLSAGADEATTNIAGAGAFTDLDAAQLAGAHVVIVCDRDGAGYRRGIHVDQLLTDVAASTRIVLPAVTAHHADAYDHLEAGHSLDQFVPVTVPELQALAALAEATERVWPALCVIPDEIAARQRLAEQADTPAIADAERQHVRRWAIESGKQISRLVEIRRELEQKEGHTAAQLAELDALLAQAGVITAAAYASAGEEPDETVQTTLEPRDGVDAESNVVSLPTRASAPKHSIPMSRDNWRYDTGDHVARGVYLEIRATKDTLAWWKRVADLPYVLARIVRRDGTGRRCGTDYLLAAEPEGKPIVVTHLSLRDGSWANDLGVELSDDDKITKAVATAIRYHATTVPEREAVPCVDDETGRIGIPSPETLPAGYLRCAPGSREAGLAIWSEILTIAAQAPKLALVLGASAVAPFIGALGRQSHVVALYGDPNQGKSITLSVAGGIWGEVKRRGGEKKSSRSGVVSHWNATTIGTLRHCGQLGILPAFFDESGMKKDTSPEDWGRLIYDVCEGAQRMTAEVRGPGNRVGHPWDGVLVSAGNGRLTDGLGAGAFAGVAKRVVDVGTPITTSANQAEHLEQLIPDAFGHAGAQILADFTTDDVQALIDEAAEVVGLPESGSVRTVAKHLHAHIAGAAMLDQIAGTGDILREAVITAAIDYLAQWDEPVHDADRVLSVIRDSIGREPAMWPTVSDFLEIRKPYSFSTDPADRASGHLLPQHGVNRTQFGIRADDHSWVAVFKGPWQSEVCAPTGIDQSVALRELHKRGVLSVTDAQRRRGEWTARIRASGVDMYKFVLPAEDDDQVEASEPFAGDPHPEMPLDESMAADLAQDESQAEPVRDADSECTGSVRGDVRGENVPLTRGVRGVRGFSDQLSHVPAREAVQIDPSRPSSVWLDINSGEHRKQWAAAAGPCEACGLACKIVIDGRRIHPLCLERAMGAAHGDTGGITAASVTSQTTTPSPGAVLATGSSAARPFTAPAVVVDDDGVHLADGRVDPLPEPLEHLGHLAELVQTYRLGWGEGRRSDPGQVHISDAIAQRLGLPIDPPADIADRTAFFAAASQLPAYVGAIAAGWQGSARGMSPWTRLWREGHPGALVVVSSWQARDAMVLDDTRGPSDLAGDLLSYARALGIAYRISPAASGVDLISKTRARARIKITEPVEIPDLGQPRIIERDLRWTRHFTPTEAGHAYLHGYDHNGAFPAVAGNLAVGIGQVQHLEGAAAAEAWDGRRPGYWQAEVADWRVTDQGHPIYPWAGMPDPADPANRGRREGRRWLTTPTIAWLAELGHEFTITAAMVFDDHTRYLDQWAASVRQARKLYVAGHLSDRVWSAIKATYAATHGRLAMADRRGEVLYRPDIHESWVAAAKISTYRRLLQIGTDTGSWPVAAITDTIFYTSDEPDPVKAWPGKAESLGLETMAQWKPYGSLDMREPVALVDGTEHQVRSLIESGKFGMASVSMIKPDAWEF